MNLFEGFFQTFQDVIFAFSPLFFIFLFFQLAYLKLSKRKLKDILVGFSISVIGLTLFLHGVHIGFMPVGQAMGEVLGGLSFKWILIPIGFILGFFVVIAEPAVSVLIHQVDKASSGYIPQKVLLYTVSIGVGIAVSLAVVRIVYGISIWYFVVPGYLIAFILTKFSTKTFISIAFDSGGVATGPMTSTFLLAMFVGIANSIAGRDPLLDGFGMVALVAMAPIISVLLLGVLYARKERENLEQDVSQS